MRRRFFLSIISTIICGAVSAQSFKGKVVDQDGVGIPYASVYVLTLPDSASFSSDYSDSLGNFNIEAPANIACFLKAGFFGFENAMSEARTLKMGQVIDLGSFPLGRSSIELDAVEISVQKPLLEKTARGFNVNVASSPVMQNGNLKQVLEKSPGVQIDNNGIISLKGKQGIRVLINGKYTYMSGEQLMQLLEGIPATDVETVEILENPPANYEAEGSGGIINIKMKKDKSLGTKGGAYYRFGHGQVSKHVGAINFTHRGPKFTLYSNSYHWNNKKWHLADQDWSVDTDSDISEFDMDSKRNIHSSGWGTITGADYDISDKHVLGVRVRLHNGGYAANTPSITVGRNDLGLEETTVDAFNDGGTDWHSNMANVNWAKEIDSIHRWSVDADFGRSGSTRWQTSTNDFLSGGVLDSNSEIQTAGMNAVHINAGQFDYYSMFKGWDFSTGVRGSWVTVNNSFDFYDVEDDVQNLNTDQSQEFSYDQSITGAYAMFAKKLDTNWSVDAGLRVEYNYSKGTSPTLDTSFTRNFINTFPTAAISYAPMGKSSYCVTLGRRIHRPKYYKLNPFETPVNQYSYDRGNPLLLPELRGVLNFTYGLKNKYFLTAEVTQVKNAMLSAIEQDESTGRKYSYTDNLDRTYNYSLNAVVPVEIRKWWNFNFNGTLYHFNVNSGSSEGVVSKSITTYNLKWQNVVKLPKDYKFEFSGYYTSSQLWNLWFVEPVYQMDIGLSKNFNGINVVLSYNDFLNIRESHGGYYQGAIDLDNYYKAETRVFSASVYLPLGNYQVKNARRRKTASQDVDGLDGN